MEILKKLLSPALYIMNKLSFKSKIIVSTSILFILLLFFPSREIFMNHYEKSTRYNKQLVGLEYIERINQFIETIQNHRGFSKSYLQGNQIAAEEMSDLENKYYIQKKDIKNYDATKFKMLEFNENFSKATALFELVKVDTFNVTLSPKHIFKLHEQIVNKLILTVDDISKRSTFSKSKDLRVNYLSDMLDDKLLHLYEYSRKIDISTVNLLKNKSMGNEEKKILFMLSTNLTGLKTNLEENRVLRRLSNYPALEEQTTSVTHKITTLLEVIDENIISDEPQIFNNQSFKNKMLKAIEAQEDLYMLFAYTYRDTIADLKSNLKENIFTLLYTFLAILLIALYIFIAFYQSITSNLRKLQTASELISSGQTRIKLNVEKKDEIGKALIAFNTMSEKLSENISFLDGYKTAIDNSSIISKTNKNGIITYANEMFCNISGYTHKELMGRSHNIIRHPDVSREVFAEMWQVIKEKKIWKGVIKNKDKTGNTYIVNATVLPILDRHGEIVEYVAVRHDITELEKSKEEIKQQRTDLLTNLPNRNQLLFDLKTAIKPIVFYLNIDNFSGFNDFYGSVIGDSVLINLGKILSNIKNQKHFKLYKLQSDQFILLFQEGYLAKNNFQFFFEDLIKEIELEVASITMENLNRVNISITGGVATYYTHDNYQNLILYSNIARKKAKLLHKKLLIFNPSMRKSEDYAENIEWIKQIKEAIAEDRVVTYYQAIRDNKTGKIQKYETLVRMLNQYGEPVSTWIFLEIAHKSNLYPQITKIVIDKSFQAFESFPEYEFSLNLTIEDILSKDTTQYIYNKLANYPTSNRVIFEITESEKVSDYGIINEFIARVKQYGVKIAIDDFGSGYANFEHIINIDADFIKIDGSLIQNIHKDENSKIITEAIINFSKKLGRKTIAEYVHDEKVDKIVKDLEADYSQGFYIGEPSSIIK